MNSYKKINEEIRVSEELKQQTMQQMTRSQKTRFPVKRIGLVTCAILVLMLGIPGLLHKHQDVQIKKTAEREESEHEKRMGTLVSFDEYLMDQDEGKTGNADITITLEPMKEKEQSRYEEELPKIEELIVPEYLKQEETIYQTWTGNQKVYPYITYLFQGRNDAMLRVVIQDERIPQCTPFETGKSFGDYQLSIKARGEDNWHVLAKKNTMIYEITADGITKEELYAFLQSFLQ